MFVTSEAFVQFLHPSAVAPPQQYWRVVTLTLERHWYLVVHKVLYKGRKVSQTALVAWEATLLDLLNEIPAEDLIGIARFDWVANHSAGWSLRWIETLWKPSQSEALVTGPLVLTLDTDPQTRNCQLLPVSQCPGRQLLFSARRFSGLSTSTGTTERN
jgi:hypothetical protein